MRHRRDGFGGTYIPKGGFESSARLRLPNCHHAREARPLREQETSATSAASAMAALRLLGGRFLRSASASRVLKEAAIPQKLHSKITSRVGSNFADNSGPNSNNAGQSSVNQAVTQVDLLKLKGDIEKTLLEMSNTFQKDMHALEGRCNKAFFELKEELKSDARDSLVKHKEALSEVKEAANSLEKSFQIHTSSTRASISDSHVIWLKNALWSAAIVSALFSRVEEKLSKNKNMGPTPEPMEGAEAWTS